MDERKELQRLFDESPYAPAVDKFKDFYTVKEWSGFGSDKRTDVQE